MVPREFRKSLCFAAGLITLLEAVVWGAVSVYIIGAYNCDWDFINVDRGVSVWSMLNITYFMGGCRGSESAFRLGYSSSFIPPASAAAGLQVWLWTNTILSAIWIPTCFLLIVAVLTEVRGKNGALLYYPWQVLTAVLVMFDFAGAVYYAADIIQTTTPDNYAKFTYATSWDNLTLQSSTDGIIALLPSLLVTLFFCRFLIIWILNIIFLLAVYRASHVVSSYKNKNLQTAPQNPEVIKSWRDMFYYGPEPIIFHNQAHFGPENVQTPINEDQIRHPDFSQQTQQARINMHVTKQELPRTTHKTDEFGIMIEELDKKSQKSNVFNLNKDSQLQSPYQQRRNIGYNGRPVTPDSFNEHWQDIPPPMAGEVKVPPELSRVRPFSYTAGDQPQMMKANISRSNSRAECPHIPQPDYSVADRRAASLEYIPNRFKIPTPKRLNQHTFNNDKYSPTQSKQVPVPLKKPQVHPRTLPTTVEVGLVPRSKYSPQTSKIRQTPNEYNINKLY